MSHSGYSVYKVSKIRMRAFGTDKRYKVGKIGKSCPNQISFTWAS